MKITYNYWQSKSTWGNYKMDPQLSKKVKWYDWHLRTIKGMTYIPDCKFIYWSEVSLEELFLKCYKTPIPLMNVIPPTCWSIRWLTYITDTTNTLINAKSDSWPTQVQCWPTVGWRVCGITFVTMTIHSNTINDNFYYLVILQRHTVYSMPFLVQILIYNGRCLSTPLDRQ